MHESNNEHKTKRRLISVKPNVSNAIMSQKITDHKKLKSNPDTRTKQSRPGTSNRQPQERINKQEINKNNKNNKTKEKNKQ